MLKGALLLRELLINYVDVEEKVSAIEEIEHQGDTYTHEISKMLTKAFAPPFDSEDIYALAGKLDDIIDQAEEAASRLLLYRVNQPTPAAVELAELLCFSVQELKKAVVFLRKPGDVLYPILERIHFLENQADRIYEQALSDLYENGLDTIKILAWRDIYDNLENAVDKCEEASNVITRILLRNF